MKEFAVFWGCTIPARFPFIEKSVRVVLDRLGLPWRECEGFTCCPEKSLINNIDHGLWVLTGARNIAIVDEQDLDLVSPCTGCISNLATIKGELHVDHRKKEEVNSMLKEVGRRFTGRAGLNHLVPFFHDKVGTFRIRSAIKKDFGGMKFAIHYGCHMMRPYHALKNDDPLEPKKFDTLIGWLGGESVNYMTKLTCCGQGLDRVDQHPTALQMARVKLRELKSIGVDAMVLCCPSCFLQFDNNQFLMEKDGESFGIPVLYFTDLLGLAMGCSPEELGLGQHRISVEGFLEKWERLNAAKDTEKRLSEELKEEGAFI